MKSKRIIDIETRVTPKDTSARIMEAEQKERGTCQFCGKADATERKDYCTFFEVKCRFCGRAFGA
jgi:hypothetical protein